METKYDEILNYLMEKKYPERFTRGQKVNLKRYAEKFTVKNGRLFFNDRRAIKSRDEAWELFKKFHSSPLGGHAGTGKTRRALCSRFYWHGMTVVIDKWVSECDKCQREGKTLSATQPLQSIKVSAVWEVVGIDLMGPLPLTSDGYQYILTAMDYFSKWVDAYPLKTTSAAEVAQRLCSIIYRYGCPQRILSDQGREFVNELNSTLCDLLHIKRSVMAAHHPQTNSLDEATNRSIKGALMKMVNETENNWDTFLEATLFSLRSNPQHSTKHSPFLLMYNREAVVPSEVPEGYSLSIVLPEEEDIDRFVSAKQQEVELTHKQVEHHIEKRLKKSNK